MHIDVIEDWGTRAVGILLSENSTWESDFSNYINRFNPEQIKHILNWVKAHITWEKSTIWQNSDRDARALKLVENALYEADYCRKNLKTRPRNRNQR